MSATEARLRELLTAAPRSGDDLIQLLSGLDWPIPADLDWEDVNLPWSLEELHLDPTKLAKLRRMSQIPPLTADQKFGVFVLDFEDGRLPVGAIRRVVQRLVKSERARAGGTHARWKLDDLIFFCLSDGEENVLHVVSLREVEGKRAIRVLSWTDRPTPARMDLLLGRGVQDLLWSTPGGGPEIVLADDFGASLRAYREGIRSAVALSKRMAEVARDVRDEIRALYEVEADGGPIRELFDDVKSQLLSSLTPERFADVYAQTMVYGLLTARIAHPDEFKAARSVSALRFDNEFLDAIYARFREHSESALDVDELGLDDLAAQLAATDVDELLADFGSDNQRDDPVVYFYEEFLAQYDPDQRRDLGAFYTPLPVVRYIVKAVDDALKSFGLPLGVADPTTWAEYVVAHPDVQVPEGVDPSTPFVSMFDPANGTGTFLVEWLRQGRRNAGDRGEEAALAHASACEISLASYAVSHLKVSLDISDDLRESTRLPIFLGDTLGARQPHVIDELADPISTEGSRADEVKFDRHHNVVIGNPPYDRDASEQGGFVLAPGKGGRSLFDDILDDAKANVIFSHTKSLNDLYVYFWRWAIWKAFERQESGPAVVSMITSSSWLAGKGFLGLRRVAREVADEIEVVDLGGAGRGARTEDNIFDIQTPVAVVTLKRFGSSDRRTPASTRYLRITGSRSDKLQALTKLASGSPGEWTQVGSGWYDSMLPSTGGSAWRESPALTDLFPWQQPGCQFGRTSPVAPLRSVLEERWIRFVETGDVADREACYNASSTGRNIHTKVPGARKLVDEPVGAGPPAVMRYAYRSFDRQWAFEDVRWAKTESPSLWGSRSDLQIYLTSMLTNKMSDGPAATLSTDVPDFHHFRGSYGGKDVIPMYRDAARTPNVDPGVLALLRERVGSSVTAERLFAYVFGVLSGTDYTARFREELETPGPRVPLTSDPELFDRMADHGERLVWLQTFAERMGDGELSTDGAEWLTTPSRLPSSKTDIAFDAAAGQLRVADGRLAGVPADVWEFEVSGMKVIQKWLGYRMSKPAGRAASSTSPLDHIRPTEWSPEWSTELVEIVAVLKQTLDLIPPGAELLDRIVEGPLILADELPRVPEELRKPPKVSWRSDQEQGLF